MSTSRSAAAKKAWLSRAKSGQSTHGLSKEARLVRINEKRRDFGQVPLQVAKARVRRRAKAGLTQDQRDAYAKALRATRKVSRSVSAWPRRRG